MSDSLKLKKSLFGFKKRTVLSYIDTVSKNVDDKMFLKDNEIKKLKKSIEEQNREIERLKKEINDFKDEKNKISEMYIHAEETAAKIIKDAEFKSTELLNETKNEVEKQKQDFEADKAHQIILLENELSAKKSQISACKNEVKCLQDKIKITLKNFDNILDDFI